MFQPYLMCACVCPCVFVCVCVHFYESLCPHWLAGLHHLSFPSTLSLEMMAAYIHKPIMGSYFYKNQICVYHSGCMCNTYSHMVKKCSSKISSTTLQDNAWSDDTIPTVELGCLLSRDLIKCIHTYTVFWVFYHPNIFQQISLGCWCIKPYMCFGNTWIAIIK